VPSIVLHSKAAILKGATTRLECCLVTSMKMGSGLKKTQFVSGAVLEFKAKAPDASPSEAVHPLLAPLLKNAAGLSSAVAKQKQ